MKRALDLGERLLATLHIVHGFLLAEPLLDASARAGFLAEHTLASYGFELQKTRETQISALAASAPVRVRAVDPPRVS